MSKKSINRQAHQNATVTPGIPASGNKFIQEIQEGAVTAANELELATVDTAEVLTPEESEIVLSESAPANNAKLKDALASATKAGDLYRTARGKLEKRLSELDERERQVKQRESTASELEKTLAGRDRDCNDRLGELIAREQEAQGGFQTLRRELLEKMDQELREQRQQLLDESEAQKAERRRLSTLERTLQQAAEEAKVRAEELDDERDRLEAKVERRVRRVQDDLAADLEQARTDLERVTQSRNLLQTEVDEYRRRRKQLGHLSEESLQQSLQEAQRQIQSLEAELSNRPDAAYLERFQTMSRENTRLISENARLTGELTSLEGDLSRINGERERLTTVKRERDILQQRSDILSVQLDHLRDEVQAFRSISGDKPVFQALTSMDRDPELNKPTRIRKVRDLTLPKLTSELQRRMASLPDSRDQRSYSDRVVRLFLGGMAMSRLHLLLGISGTGKTSLPRAAAKALGWEAPMIEVQSGWTDRTDLIGHYNAFEKRYYETKFLQALYAAQTPGRRDIPHLIVLDEMNLSQPEQFFADFLSLMERRPGDRPLMVTPNSFDQVPGGLDRSTGGGLDLQVGENIWFIGTANMDESSKTFVDKTLDRAHVMNLPRPESMIEPTDNLEEMQVSYTQLRDLFDGAVSEYGEQGVRAYERLNQEFGKFLLKHFELGWGARLKTQMETFVPVVIAAGGTAGEAVDHILSNRVLRKLEGKFNVNTEHLQALMQLLEDHWFRDGSKPDHSRRLLQGLVDTQEAAR